MTPEEHRAEVVEERHTEWEQGARTPLTHGVIYSNDGQAMTAENYNDQCVCKHSRPQHQRKCAGHVGKFSCPCPRFVLKKEDES